MKAEDAPSLFDQVLGNRRKVLSVFELTRLVRGVLETQFDWVWVAGEVSNLRRPRSGHLYFTLKDDRAQLRAVMWRPLAAGLKFRLADGMEVMVGGGITVYAPRGEYQIVARTLEPRGIGALELAFQQLKEKLQSEGLFAAEHKKPIPLLPRHIAIVTSPTGAAVHDILQIINRRFPRVHVTVYPVKVQGEGAAREIAEGIAVLDRLGGFDVIITGRGGGSLEDLWAFNEEVVARAIFACRVPVISAVGHEIDVTISDLVADQRARTPSEAAELVVPDERAILDNLRTLHNRLLSVVLRRVGELKTRMAASRGLLHPGFLVEAVRLKGQHLDDLTQRLQLAVSRMLQRHRDNLVALGGKLEHLSPLKVLARGYSITRRRETGEVVKNSEDLSPGEQIESLLARGYVISRVKSVARRHPFEADSREGRTDEEHQL